MQEKPRIVLLIGIMSIIAIGGVAISMYILHARRDGETIVPERSESWRPRES